MHNNLKCLVKEIKPGMATFQASPIHFQAALDKPEVVKLLRIFPADINFLILCNMLVFLKELR